MVQSKNKKKRELTLIIVGLAVIAVILAILIGHLSRLEKGGPPLPFEEVYATSKQLSRDIRLVDKAISDGLYAMGVPQEGIVFLSVVPREKDGYYWDFNDIKAMIPRQHPLSQVGNEIRTRVSNLRRPVEITIAKQSPKEIIYHIFCSGLFTHRLNILRDGYPPPHRLPCPKIGIIIDDVGYDSSLARAFIQLDLPLTLSILPFAPGSKSIAQRAKQEGREIMLHLPMEPINYPAVNPGDGVLLLSMDKEMILEVLNRDLSRVPFVSGVNNHMGSRFTESEEKMVVVLTELKRRGLYFVDSRTTSRSVAFKVAKRMALRTAKRDIFLDNELSENALKIQMERLLSLARQKGWAIGIGHPHQETLELLKRYESTLTHETEVVPISRLVN